MRMEKTCLMLALCLFLIGCNWAQQGNYVKGEGPVVTKELQLDNFKGIGLAVAGKVYLTKGNSQKVTVEAQQNIIDLLKTEVKGDHWNIGFKDKTRVRNYESLVIRITVPDINALSIAGSGSIIGESAFDGMDELEVSISGSGDMSLAGSANKLSISIAGSGNVSMQDLKAQDAEVSISGSGDCKVDVTRELDVSIAGSGDVSYKGSPRVSSSVAGSGKVRSM